MEVENKGLPFLSVYIMEPQNSWAKCSMMMMRGSAASAASSSVLIFLHNVGIFRFNTPIPGREAPRTTITTKTTTPNQKLHPNYNCFAYKRRGCSGRRRTSAIYTLPQGNASSSYFSSSSNAYEIGSARCAGGLGRERNFKIIMILDFLEPALSLLSPPNIMAE